MEKGLFYFFYYDRVYERLFRVSNALFLSFFYVYWRYVSVHMYIYWRSILKFLLNLDPDIKRSMRHYSTSCRQTIKEETPQHENYIICEFFFVLLCCIFVYNKTSSSHLLVFAMSFQNLSKHNLKIHRKNIVQSLFSKFHYLHMLYGN